MTVKWFRQAYDAPIYKDCPRTDTPVGANCPWCHELIEAGDDGFQYANGPYAHRECYLRGVIGSVAHQQRHCSRFGYEGEDEVTMTRREAAKAAVAYFEGRVSRG